MWPVLAKKGLQLLWSFFKYCSRKGVHKMQFNLKSSLSFQKKRKEVVVLVSWTYSYRRIFDSRKQGQLQKDIWQQETGTVTEGYLTAGNRDSYRRIFDCRKPGHLLYLFTACSLHQQHKHLFRNAGHKHFMNFSCGFIQKNIQSAAKATRSVALHGKIPPPPNIVCLVILYITVLLLV